jgi:hypothetical protein
MNWGIVSVFVICNIAVLIYLKFKIDKWGYFTLFMHLIASLLRVFTPSFQESQNFEDLESSLIMYEALSSLA